MVAAEGEAKYIEAFNFCPATAKLTEFSCQEAGNGLRLAVNLAAVLQHGHLTERHGYDRKERHECLANMD